MPIFRLSCKWRLWSHNTVFQDNSSQFRSRSLRANCAKLTEMSVMCINKLPYTWKQYFTFCYYSVLIMAYAVASAPTVIRRLAGTSRSRISSCLGKTVWTLGSEKNILAPLGPAPTFGGSGPCRKLPFPVW